MRARLSATTPEKNKGGGATCGFAVSLSDSSASSLCSWRWSSYFSFCKISCGCGVWRACHFWSGAVREKRHRRWGTDQNFCVRCVRNSSDCHLDVCARPGKWGLTKLTFGQLKNDWRQLISQDQKLAKILQLMSNRRSSGNLKQYAFSTELCDFGILWDQQWKLFLKEEEEEDCPVAGSAWFSGRPWSVWRVSAWVRWSKRQGYLKKLTFLVG